MAPGLLRPYVPNCGMATGGPWFLRKGQEDTCPPPRNPCISMAIQTSNALLGPCRRNGESAPVLWACLLCRIIRWTAAFLFDVEKVRRGEVWLMFDSNRCVCVHAHAGAPPLVSQSKPGPESTWRRESLPPSLGEKGPCPSNSLLASGLGHTHGDTDTHTHRQETVR